MNTKFVRCCSARQAIVHNVCSKLYHKTCRLPLEITVGHRHSRRSLQSSLFIDLIIIIIDDATSKITIIFVVIINIMVMSIIIIINFKTKYFLVTYLSSAPTMMVITSRGSPCREKVLDSNAIQALTTLYTWQIQALTMWYSWQHLRILFDPCHCQSIHSKSKKFD